MVQAKKFTEAIKESTCQKRVTVCEIYNIHGSLLVRESNRCNPEGGVCCRLDVVQNKENYDKDSNCNWIHAEINALNKIWISDNAHKAIVYGHDFICDNCEQALKSHGIKIIQVVGSLPTNKTIEEIMREHNLFGPIREPAPYYYERVRLVMKKYADQECAKILSNYTG